jgi:hypothetical protein
MTLAQEIAHVHVIEIQPCDFQFFHDAQNSFLLLHLFHKPKAVSNAGVSPEMGMAATMETASGLASQRTNRRKRLATAVANRTSGPFRNVLKSGPDCAADSNTAVCNLAHAHLVKRDSGGEGGSSLLPAHPVSRQGISVGARAAHNTRFSLMTSA